jgi:choline-glycine betaine transporter
MSTLLGSGLAHYPFLWIIGSWLLFGIAMVLYILISAPRSLPPRAKEPGVLLMMLLWGPLAWIMFMFFAGRALAKYRRTGTV